MFLLPIVIKAHLDGVPHFETWDVRHNMEAVSRQLFPAVDLRIVQATVPSAGSAPAGKFRVVPALSVQLVVKRSDGAAGEELHKAFVAICRALHGYTVNDPQAGSWKPLSLEGVREVPEASGELVGFELLFTLSGYFEGSGCGC
jgi:hypothetical protein